MTEGKERTIHEPDQADMYSYPLKLELLPPACGFANMGATCYWNALLQALFSCTSLREVITKNRTSPTYASHPVIQSFLRIYDAFSAEAEGCDKRSIPIVTDLRDATAMTSRRKAIEYKADILNKFTQLSGELWQTTQNYRASKGLPAFQSGQQQDANEMFVYLADILDNLNEVMDLMIHKYQVLIYCHMCNKWVSNVMQNEIFFAVDPNLTTEQRPELSKLIDGEIPEGNLDQYLFKRRGYVDKDYKCPECKIAGERVQVYVLKRVSSIIMVTSKNYYKRENLVFPPYLLIPCKKPKSSPESEKRMMRYEAVSQIQHSGGMSGGHYWAIARRSPMRGSHETNWWNLNDSSASQTNGGLQPDANTYCVFYHYVGNEIINI